MNNFILKNTQLWINQEDNELTTLKIKEYKPIAAANNLFAAQKNIVCVCVCVRGTVYIIVCWKLAAVEELTLYKKDNCPKQ